MWDWRLLLHLPTWCTSSLLDRVNVIPATAWSTGTRSQFLIQFSILAALPDKVIGWWLILQPRTIECWPWFSCTRTPSCTRIRQLLRLCMSGTQANSWSHWGALALATQLLASCQQALVGRWAYKRIPQATPRKLLLRILTLYIGVAVWTASLWLEIGSWHKVVFQNLLGLTASLDSRILQRAVRALPWNWRFSIELVHFACTWRNTWVLRRVCCIVCTAGMGGVPARMVRSSLSLACHLHGEHFLLSSSC